ncbi:hypothetical protein VJ918_05770 [Adlercreutzia sp. R21]|uniref:hypothetical protein n=1 Tax=Adlercreutzia wanghongyangiae TaxID=3111451 RepID=UPI002DBBE05D|nr:hypothetical protein [Adlercreutzia sp. R21]MEC4184315.1 hypothetical protein [Adlercreutzia sp. R21]
MSDTHPINPHHGNLENRGEPSANVDDFLQQYASTIRAEQAPARTRAQLQETFQARRAASAEQSRSAETSGSGHTLKPLGVVRHSRRTARFAVAAASTAVFILAGAGAVALGAGNPQGVDLAAPSVGQQANNPADNAPDSPAGNFFVLKAWADEATEANVAVTSRDPMGINWLHPAFVTSWESWQEDPVFGELLEPGEALAYFNFDAQCEGANLASVSYRIDNKDAFFEYFDWQEANQLKAAGEDPEQCVERGSSFTLTYGSDGSAATAFTRLYVIAPCPDGYDANPHATEGYLEAAQVLDGSIITLMAAFDDGSTQEQAYRIAMAADFEEKCPEFLTKYFAAWDVAGPQGKEAILDETSDAPKLFTLEPIDA